MALNEKEQRFIRHMEADDSLHDAGRLKTYVDLQQKSGNPTFGNADLERYYRQSTGATKSQLGSVPTPTTPATPAKPGFDQEAYAKQYQDQINNMYNQQREAQLGQLRAQRDKAVGQINQQKSQVVPAYQTARNQTDAVNLQNVNRLREAMASAGLTASGENVTAQVAQNNQRQSNLNSLNLQERQTIEDFDRRIADLNDPTQENAMMAALEAERSRALLDLGMRADEIGYSRGRDALADQRYDTEWNYQVGRDKVADSRYDTEWNYQVGRDKVADTRYDQQWENQLEQQKLDEQWRQKEWNELSPAEKAAAQLDYEYYKKKQALSGSRGGGGGYGGSGGGGGATSSAKASYQQAQASSAKSPVDKYYEAMEPIFKGSVVRQNPVVPIPSIGSNPNISNYDKLQLIKQQYGIR